MTRKTRKLFGVIGNVVVVVDRVVSAAVAVAGEEEEEEEEAEAELGETVTVEAADEFDDEYGDAADSDADSAAAAVY